MNMKLREADARAVDLLLDRAASAQNGNGGNGGMFTAMLTTSHAGVSNEQVSAVEKVLHLLDAMPAPDPDQNLLALTLARVDNSTAAPLRGANPALIDAGRPVA
jgi:hypothetical protein